MEIGNSIQTEFSFFDKSIKEKNCQCYKLFAHYNKNCFSFSVFDIEKEKFLNIESYIFKYEEENLKYLISKFPILKWNFNSFSFNYYFKGCTLIPNSLFDEKLQQKYLEINNQIDKSDVIFFDQLKHINAVAIYSIPRKDLDALNQFENIKIKHSGTIFLENVLEKSKHSTENEIFIDVSTKNFNIAYIKKSKLHFYNNFEFENKNEFLYYILNCYNTLNLNSKQISLRLSGEFEKNEIFNDLKMYVKKIILENRPKLFRYSHVFNTIPNHYFHKLFNQIKCE